MEVREGSEDLRWASEVRRSDWGARGRCWVSGLRRVSGPGGACLGETESSGDSSIPVRGHVNSGGLYGQPWHTVNCGSFLMLFFPSARARVTSSASLQHGEGAAPH